MGEHVDKMINVVTSCSFAALGMECLFSSDFEKKINVVRDARNIPRLEEGIVVLLIVDLSSLCSIADLRRNLNFFRNYKGKKRVGVIVSRYNVHVSKAIFLWLREKCVFFMPRNLTSFSRQVLLWIKGRTVNTFPVVYNCRDSRYHLSLWELIILIFSIAGEPPANLATILKIPLRTLYYKRDSGARKLGLNGYKDFCMAYMRGNVRLEIERLVNILGRCLVLEN
ncbi:hypothetical protein [Escherichia coli]|uniref:hypothetical protein n=1 Tax=Escherichia coli TaxID=562 RepID=UPI0013028EE7|nr:hypothetical protein [Escherichia coli]KAE9666514.1 hypothetical protein GP722_21285 [Escherichia coli]